MEEEVKRALLDAGFAASELQLEVTPSGNVGGFIISPRFVGQSQIDRQEALWKVLDARLSAEQRHRVVALLTMTPDEVEDEVRVANG